MAVLGGIGQVVAGKLGQKFKSFVGGLGKGKVGLPPSMSDFKKLGAAASGGMTNLSFPLDVTSGPESGNHGHYVVFFINAQTNAKIGFSNPKSTDMQYSDYGSGNPAVQKTNENLMAKATNVGTNVYASVESGAGGGVPTKKQKREQTAKSRFESPDRIVVKRRPTRAAVASISMYMPSQVATTYGAQYTDTKMGLFTGDALNVFDNLTSSGADGLSASKSINKVFTDLLPQSLALFTQSTLGILPGLGGLREARGIMTGEIISDRLELAFKGINKRKFQYTFKMIPKSATEAAEIKDIITQFKKNMLPEFAGGDKTGRRFVVPNTFTIQYMYDSKENSFLHKIGECVLENMTVSYGGDKYRTYTPQGDGAPPIETTITLAFSEMDLVTRENIEEGF